MSESVGRKLQGDAREEQLQRLPRSPIGRKRFPDTENLRTSLRRNL